MAYLLTQEDIDKLGIMDAAPGDQALPEEMKMLGVSDAAPAPAVQAAPAASAPAPSAASGGGILNFVMPSTPEEDLSYLTDPYANLSQTQRRLLAFAAIKDAGMALQGKDGGSFQAMLGDITARADMARKARAATAQQELMMQMLGGGLASGVGSSDAIRQRIAQLVQFAAMNPSAAPGIDLMIKNLQSDLERIGQAEETLVAQNLGTASIDALLASPNLGAITGFSGTVNEWLNKFGAAPEYANLTSYLDQIRGLNFVEAYQQLKGGGPITEQEGRAATAARTRLDAALKGRPEDLRVALLEARALFEDARAKNPAYNPAAQQIPEDLLQYLPEEPK